MVSASFAVRYGLWDVLSSVSDGGQGSARGAPGGSRPPNASPRNGPARFSHTKRPLRHRNGTDIGQCSCDVHGHFAALRHQKSSSWGGGRLTATNSALNGGPSSTSTRRPLPAVSSTNIISPRPPSTVTPRTQLLVHSKCSGPGHKYDAFTYYRYSIIYIRTN